MPEMYKNILPIVCVVILPVVILIMSLLQPRSIYENKVGGGGGGGGEGGGGVLSVNLTHHGVKSVQRNFTFTIDLFLNYMYQLYTDCYLNPLDKGHIEN